MAENQIPNKLPAYVPTAPGWSAVFYSKHHIAGWPEQLPQAEDNEHLPIFGVTLSGMVLCGSEADFCSARPAFVTDGKRWLYKDGSSFDDEEAALAHVRAIVA